MDNLLASSGIQLCVLAVQVKLPSLSFQPHSPDLLLPPPPPESFSLIGQLMVEHLHALGDRWDTFDTLDNGMMGTQIVDCDLRGVESEMLLSANE